VRQLSNARRSGRVVQGSRMRGKNAIAAASALAVAVGFAAQGIGAVYTYTPPSSTTDTWSTGTDWSSTPVSDPTTELTFVGSNGTVLPGGLINTNTDDLGGAFSLNILDLNGTGPSSGAADSITIAASGSNLNFVSNGGTTPVINLNALNGTAAALNYTVSAPITLTNNTTFQGNGTAGFNFSGVISGGSTLTKTGTSTLTLSAANTFTGGLVINGGTVISASSGGASSLGEAAVTVNAGATLQGSRGDSFGFSNGTAPHIININGGTVSETSGSFRITLPDLTFSNGGTLTNNGNNGDGNGNFSFRGDPANGGGTANITVNASATAATINAVKIWMQAGNVNFNIGRGTAAADLVINAPLINGGNFNKNGAGILSLTRASTYTGNTTTNAGTLLLDFSAAGAPTTNILPQASRLFLASGTLMLNGSPTAAVSQTMNNTTLAGNASVSLVSNGNPVLLNLGTVAAGGGTVDFTLPTGTQTATNGVLASGVSNVNGILPWATINGNTWGSLSGSNIVPYAGGYTDVPSGGLIPNASAANVRFVPGLPGAGTLTAGNATINSLLLNTSGAVIVDTTGGTFDIGSGGVFVPAGTGPLEIGTAQGGGNVTAGTSGAGTLLINDASTNSVLISSTIIDNGAGNTGLTTTGIGQTVLFGANTFHGDTNAGAGGLLLNNSLALQNSTINSANIQFGSVVGSNAFTVGGMKGNFAMSLTNALGQPIAITFGGNNQTNTFSGSISGAGSLVKVGTGTETFSTANTFTGGLVINAGEVISTTGGSASGLGSGPVIVNAGATLLGNGQDSFGFGSGLAPTVITINGGTVTEANSGTYRITLADLTFANGGTLSDGGDAGDGNGNFSFRGNPLNNGATANVNVLPSATQATITARKIWMQATNVNFNVQRGTSPIDLLVTGSLINGGNFIKNGDGIMSLNAPASYTGGTTLNGGTVILDHANTASNIFPLGLGFIEGGGTLLVKGNGSGSVSELFDSIAFFTGASGLAAQQVNGQDVSVTMDFIINRTTGATVNFTPPGADTPTNGLMTATAPVNGIIGGFATVNNTDWATTDPNVVAGGFLNPIIALPATSYTNIALGTAIPDNQANNIKITGGSGSVTLAGGSAGTTHANTLLLASGTSAVVDIGGNGGATGGGTLVLGSDYGALEASGGVLMQPNAGSLTLGTAPNSGILMAVPGSSSPGELVLFNNSSNPLTVNSTITDNGTSGAGLTVAGSGLVILAGDNTYPGQTTVGAGTLQVGTGGANGQIGTGNVVNNGALIFNRTGAMSVAAISGTGSVTLNGSASLTLNAAGNFAGGLTINGGTVISNAGGANAPIGSGPVAINAGATLQGNAGDAFGYYPNAAPQVLNINGGTVTEGAGAYRVTLPNLVFNNGGTLSSGSNTGDGNGNFSLFGVNGAVSITVNNTGNTTASLSAARIGVQSNLTLIVSRGTASADVAISSVLSNFNGTHSITVAGNGITTFSGANSYSGGLFVTGGTVISTTSAGTTGLGAGPVTVFPGATLLGGAADAFGYNAGASPNLINIAGGTVSETAGNFRVTLPNITFTNGGTLASGSNGGDGNGNFSFFGPNVTVNASPNAAVVSARTIALQANNANPGSVTFNVARGGGPQDLLVSSVLRNFGNNTNGVTVTGNGISSFTGANLYTGPTAVTGGTFLANNATGSATGPSGAVTVASGAALGGNGSIAGATNVNQGGTISAGDMFKVPGNLTIAGATTLASGSGAVGDAGNGATYLWKLNNAAGTAGNSSGWDKLALSTLAVSGTGSFVTIAPISTGGGFLNGPAANFVPTQTYQWQIATLSGGGGGTALAAQFHLDTNALSTFATANNTSPNYFSVSSDPGDVYISYNPAPEPTSLALAGLAAGGLLLRRRRNRRA
jgi:fibronectin-binding autotransporter adhesin